jgi:hypothetical protein
VSIERKQHALARIIVEPPRVIFTGATTFHAPDTSTFLEGVPDDDRHDYIARLLELGTQVSGAITTSTTLRMVEAQMTALSQNLASKLGEVLVADRQISLKEVRALLDEHRTTVTSNLTRYLDPESQASLPVAMSKVFDKAGEALIKRVELLVSEGDDSALGRLAARFTRELGKSTALIIEQLAARHALVTKSALAGRPYEDCLEERLLSLARPLGDQVTRTSDTLGQTRRRCGDMVITAAPDAVNGRSNVRIVVEAKRRSERAQGFTAAEIQNSLELARRNRGANAGLFVTESAALLPLDIGFHEYGATSIAVAFDPMTDDTALAVAYRLLRVGLIQQVRESQGKEIDRDAHGRIISDIRLAMGKLEQVRSQHQAAVNSITKATALVNDLDDAVLGGLRDLDELMGA